MHNRGECVCSCSRASRHIACKLVEVRFRLAGRPAEERAKLVRKHARAAEKVKVLEVEPELTGRQHLDQLAHLARIRRLPVGREAHHFVFGVVDVETEVGRHRAVEETEGVGKSNLLEELDPGARASAVRRRRPLSDRVHDQDRGVIPAGKVKRRRRVRQMVRHEFDTAVPAQQLTQFARRPRRIELEEKRWRQRRDAGQPHPQLPSELHHRILVPRHAIDVGDGDARVRQAPLERLSRQRGIVLETGEPLFLRGGGEPAAD
jgi:hypothetical protein